MSTKAATNEALAAVNRGGRIPISFSLDEKISDIMARKPSNEKVGQENLKKKTSASDLARGETAVSEGNVVGSNSNKVSQVRTPSRDENATKGMFAFSMFSRKKAGTSSSFDADLPLEKCLVEVGRILQALGCSVMMKRGESKMKCEAPVKKEKMLVSITCTHDKGTTTVVFKKGRKDRSRVDARDFLDFFKTVYNKFIEKLGADQEAAS